jgi:hypothetical protein
MRERLLLPGSRRSVLVMRMLFASACALCVVWGCHGSSSGSSETPPESGPPPSASAGPIASGRAGLRLPQLPAHPGTDCDPEKDAAVCSPDGTSQMSCSLGHWQLVHVCDGPEGCKGRGDKLVCDLKPVNEGDPCTGGINPPRCNNAYDVMACVFNKWKKTTCSPPGKCQAATTDMPAGCRLGS